jgi:hypothetical protein
LDNTRERVGKPWTMETKIQIFLARSENNGCG